MERRTPDFSRVLATISHKSDGDFAALRGDEIDGVLELAFLMANANGLARHGA